MDRGTRTDRGRRGRVAAPAVLRQDMYLVLGGEGTVEVRENGRARTIEVKGAPTLYALASHTRRSALPSCA